MTQGNFCSVDDIISSYLNIIDSLERIKDKFDVEPEYISHVKIKEETTHLEQIKDGIEELKDKMDKGMLNVPIYFGSAFSGLSDSMDRQFKEVNELIIEKSLNQNPPQPNSGE